MYLTPIQVAQYAYDAGFRNEKLVLAVAIAGAESTFNTNAINGQYVGLWQVGTYHVSNPSLLYQPAYNAQATYLLSAGGTNFDPWQTYTKGYYKKFLGIATTVAQEVETKAIYSDSIPAIAVPDLHGKNTVYFLWVILPALNIKYRKSSLTSWRVGSKLYNIFVYKGKAYVPWYAVPGMKMKQLSHSYLNFTKPMGHVDGKEFTVSLTTGA